MRVLIAFGTRPEAVKCFPVIEALRHFRDVELKICASGQHQEILDQVLELCRIKPDYALTLPRAGQGLTLATCDLLERLGWVMDKARPDRVLVQGDTTTTMAAALAAGQRKISVGHIEAGLRSGNPLAPWPEETNRRIVSAIADIHFAPTFNARQNLLRESIHEDTVYVTGNTAIDALLSIKQRLEKRNYVSPVIAALVDRASHLGRRLILITAHRRESWGAGISNICEIARRIVARGDVEVVFPVHPNPIVREPVRQHLSHYPSITLLEPLDYLTFVDLMRRCTLVLTDSGGIQEEAPALGIPALVLRETTERPEGIAAGSAKLVGLDPDRAYAEAANLLDDHRAYKAMSTVRNPYGDGTAAARIAAIIGKEAASGARQASRMERGSDQLPHPRPFSFPLPSFGR
jgi:UDP-N-acetylglucosamine 2-epimerase (non-hydrolysing)